jgi:hypothetical protein
MRGAIHGWAAMISALALGGCDGVAVVAFTPTGPPGTPPLIASIGWSPGWSLVDPAEHRTVAAPPIALVISARVAIDVQQLTIHLIDGSNLGGPMITVPKNQLTTMFRTTHIPSGMTRTFTLMPSFVLTRHPQAVRIDIVCVDVRGVTHFASIQDPLP